MQLERNKHVWEYLEYYISFPHPPRYAVLLNGPWGIGKTFLVKKFLARHFGDKADEYVYLSLYGLSSIAEIDEALFAAIYPALASKSAKVAGRVVKSALKVAGIELDLQKGDLLNKFKANLYIFDDLERCGMMPNQVLGYINEFVEQDDCKVVIIANEKEISNIEEYRRRREKLIGKTLEFESAFEEALAHFISVLDDHEAQGLIQRRVGDISTIYHQSELNNLRILQQSIWDFERVFRVLSEGHRTNESALSVLLRMFLALSFEVKSGRMGSADLGSRMSQVILAMMAVPNKGAQPTPIQVAIKRYPDANLGDSILSDELLTDILLRGLVNGNEIRESLDRSPYFVNPKDEPAWRALWHALERPDDEVNRALAEVERQFAAREFTATGEILHVFGLRLWLSDIEVLPKALPEVVQEGRDYIDALYAQKRLEPSSLLEFHEGRFDGYEGLGIHQTGTPEYRDLFEYLSDKRSRAAADRYPERAEELLKDMKTAPDLYRRRLSDMSSDDCMCGIPILASIEPDAFVDLFLQQTPSRQLIIMGAFKGRYEHGQLTRELAAEVPWLRAVRDRLVSAAGAMSKIGRYRMELFVQRYIATFLEEPTAGDCTQG